MAGFDNLPGTTTNGHGELNVFELDKSMFYLVISKLFVCCIPLLLLITLPFLLYPFCLLFNINIKTYPTTPSNTQKKVNMSLVYRPGSMANKLAAQRSNRPLPVICAAGNSLAHQSHAAMLRMGFKYKISRVSMYTNIYIYTYIHITCIWSSVHLQLYIYSIVY